jgi:hypothetical protein
VTGVTLIREGLTYLPHGIWRDFFVVLSCIYRGCFMYIIRATTLVTAALLAPFALSAQRGSDNTAPRVAVLDVALYNAGANVQETKDTAVALLATSVLRDKLHELLGSALVDSAQVIRAGTSDSARAITGGGKACNVIVACGRYVGQHTGAAWVVMAKVSKTSNLIWLFTGQLINVRTGELVLDDSTELKGDPEPMVRAGTRIFAERVARVVKQQVAATR